MLKHLTTCLLGGLYFRTYWGVFYFRTGWSKKVEGPLPPPPPPSSAAYDLNPHQICSILVKSTTEGVGILCVSVQWANPCDIDTPSVCHSCMDLKLSGWFAEDKNKKPVSGHIIRFFKKDTLHVWKMLVGCKLLKTMGIESFLSENNNNKNKNKTTKQSKN